MLPAASHDPSANAYLDASRTVFIVISFEGPDRWSQAGGLGVRVTGLADSLAALGHEVHVFFIGDPERPGEETYNGVQLHRWSQWLSRHYRAGVYDGEEEKRADLTASLPSFVTEKVVIPAIRAGKVPIVLFEEWQTAECASLVSDHLHLTGLRDQAILAWNANNAYSFDRIDWPRLASSAMITTVSRYMRSIIRARGFDALVIPNGIPERLTRPMRPRELQQVRDAFAGMPFFFKMARWGNDKGWTQALDAMRLLRERDDNTLMVARAGGPNGAGGALESEGERRGLRVQSVDSPAEIPVAVESAKRGHTDVLNLRFGVTEELARGMYAAADGTLANSVSEPFGLVGLEAMAAGGLLYTGGTGEDYAVSGRNAVVLETLEPGEIADRAQELREDPDTAARIRRNARRRARDFRWECVAEVLVGRLRLQGLRQGLSTV
ncbi:MAG TPA: glycosyltransferase [Gemmatimonadaceae bacterium]|nr:glycosyltransferase [Gemmatimonadaceae bacterium]